MTNTEFYNAIIKAEINDELTAFASEKLTKIHLANERAKQRRKSRPTKAQVENAPLREKLEALLLEGETTAAAAGQALGISTQKASAILCGMQKDGVCVAAVGKHGKIYSIPSDEVVAE